VAQGDSFKVVSNSIWGENKVFFAAVFGIVGFIVYVFIRDELLGGRPAGSISRCARLGVSARGWKVRKAQFHRVGRRKPSFFISCRNALLPLQLTYLLVKISAGD
jgi:hypothetical protein